MSQGIPQQHKNRFICIIFIFWVDRILAVAMWIASCERSIYGSVQFRHWHISQSNKLSAFSIGSNGKSLRMTGLNKIYRRFVDTAHDSVLDFWRYTILIVRRDSRGCAWSSFSQHFLCRFRSLFISKHCYNSTDNNININDNANNSIV